MNLQGESPSAGADEESNTAPPLFGNSPLYGDPNERSPSLYFLDPVTAEATIPPAPRQIATPSPSSPPDDPTAFRTFVGTLSGVVVDPEGSIIQDPVSELPVERGLTVDDEWQVWSNDGKCAHVGNIKHIGALLDGHDASINWKLPIRCNVAPMDGEKIVLSLPLIVEGTERPMGIASYLEGAEGISLERADVIGVHAEAMKDHAAGSGKRPATSPEGSIEISQKAKMQFNKMLARAQRAPINARRDAKSAASSKFQRNPVAQTAFRIISVLSSGVNMAQTIKRGTSSIGIGSRKKPKKNTAPARPLRLAPCPPAPKPGTSKFDALVKEQLVIWFWKFMVENDLFDLHAQRELAKLQAKKATLSKDEIICWQFDIMTGKRLAYEDRVAIRENVKSRTDYEVTEMTSLLLAPKQFIKGVCGNGLGKRSFLQNHPFPIGPWSGGKPSRKAFLRFIYDEPKIILALAIYLFVNAWEKGNLRADAPQLGTWEFGYHWSTTAKAELSLHGHNIMGATRLASLSDAVVMGYHYIIKDSNQSFVVNGEVIHFGLDYLADEAQASHIGCFDREKLKSGIGAHNCFALVGHVANCHMTVNLGANITCKGGQVSILTDEDGVETRYLSVHCRCGDEPGNPGRRTCGFVNYSRLKSEAVATERIKGGRTVSYDTRDRVATTQTGACASEAKVGAGEIDKVTMQLQLRDLIGERKVDPNKSPQLQRLGNECNIDTSEHCLFMIDFESNALKGQQVHILEAGSFQLTNDTAKSEHEIAFCAYMNPGQEFDITARAFEINGISKDTLLGRRSTKVELMALINFWEGLCGERTLVLVGHNIRTFDLPLLKKEMGRHGIERTEMITGAQCIDTYQLLKDGKVWKDSEWGTPDRFGLGALYEHVFGEKLPKAHSAMGDIMGNAKLLLEVDPSLEHASAHMKPANL